MKLILSRKGFDSAAGGAASPIFPDGSMYSLPIAAEGACKPYAAIHRGNAVEQTDLGLVVERLSRGRIARQALAHLDPDLGADALPRLPGWRPCFGQTSSAQAHLATQGVGFGDVFLFFGWFRRVQKDGRGGWRRTPESRDLHVVFGWLQIGDVIPVHAAGVERLSRERPWLRDHPHMHFRRPEFCRRNVIYAASDGLVLPGLGDTGLPGGGEIGQVRPQLVLTAEQSSRRGRWLLPKWFAADVDRTGLSYHRDAGRWIQTENGVLLDTVGRGQEFVLDCARRPEAARWIADLLLPAEGGHKAKRPAPSV
jgi:hypothetical protein